MASIFFRQVLRNLNGISRSLAPQRALVPAVSVPLVRSSSDVAHTEYEIIDPHAAGKLSKEVISKVNQLLSTGKQGRLFAVVHLAGKQFKITEGDVIVIEGYWPPDAGDKIRLDKVLLVGASDFTLIGRPLVQKGLVNVEATVIEKTVSHTKTHFRKKRRKQYMRINCKNFTSLFCD